MTETESHTLQITEREFFAHLFSMLKGYAVEKEKPHTNEERENLRVVIASIRETIKEVHSLMDEGMIVKFFIDQQGNLQYQAKDKKPLGFNHDLR